MWVIKCDGEYHRKFEGLALNSGITNCWQRILPPYRKLKKETKAEFVDSRSDVTE